MRIVACSAWIPVVVALAACSGGSQPASDPYAADVRRAQEQVTSDFERAVFKDGKITRAEYVEGVQRYIQCMHDHGSDIEARESGQGYFTYVQTKTGTMEQLDELCRKGTIQFIEPIYTGLIMNPEKAAFPDLMARCLVRHKVAPAGYSGQDYARDSAKNFSGAPYDANGQEAQACMANPSRP